jgi:hypothetical protein
MISRMLLRTMVIAAGLAVLPLDAAAQKLSVSQRATLDRLVDLHATPGSKQAVVDRTLARLSPRQARRLGAVLDRYAQMARPFGDPRLKAFERANEARAKELFNIGNERQLVAAMRQEVGVDFSSTGLKPLGALRTQLPDGRWALQIVAGDRTATLTVNRRQRGTVRVTSTPMSGGLGAPKAPFVLSQMAIARQADERGTFHLEQDGDIVYRSSMQGVSVPLWHSFGKPATYADSKRGR